MKAIGKTQSDHSKWMRLLALSCIVLALFMCGLEAMHAHSDAASASPNSSPSEIGKTQSDHSKWMRLLALSCIVLALFMCGLEAMHAHSDAASASPNSSPC